MSPVRRGRRVYARTPLARLSQEAFHFLRRTMRAEMSAAAALRAFRQAGYHIRTQFWYDAWRYLREAQERARAINFTPFGLRPTIGAFTVIPQRMPFRYRFLVEVRLRDLRTGEIMTKPAYVHADRLTTREQMLTAFAQELSYLREGPAGTAWEFSHRDIRVVEAYAYFEPGEPIE